MPSKMEMLLRELDQTNDMFGEEFDKTERVKRILPMLIHPYAGSCGTLPIAFHEEAKRAYGSLEHENCVSLVHEKLPPFSFMVCKAFVGIFLIIRYRQNIFVNSPPKEIESKMIEMASKIGRFSTRGEKSFVTPEYWLTDEDGNRRFETSDATVIRKVKK